jgi:hypothetical protein
MRIYYYKNSNANIVKTFLWTMRDNTHIRINSNIYPLNGRFPQANLPAIFPEF